MSSVWDERAEAYRTSEAHREGEDLDLLVEWAQGARTALDVATGGGHVARRLREAGLDVVSLDPAPGMEPDVLAPAEKLPFDDDSFDVVACRVAAHHFEDVRAAVREMARVSRDLVLVSDNLFAGEDAEEADRVRDPVARPQLHRRRVALVLRRRGVGGRAGARVRARRSPGAVARAGRLHREGRRARARARRRPPRRRPRSPGARLPHGSEAEGGLVAIVVDRDTRLVVQGITGREGSFHATRNKAYGTNVVAGVTPGKGGAEVEGIPVFDSVRAAAEETSPNTAMVFVPARFAADAIYEAVDAGIETVICITEGIPAHDMLRVYNYIRPRGVTLIGPNCPGVLSPGKANVGIIPAEIFQEGGVGLVSRSGTLTYQIGHELTQLGIGQSTIVGIGGDPVVGSSFLDVLARFEADPETEYVVMVGEIGGAEEEKAARFIEAEMTKPVVAYIAGFTAPPGKTMGHAGAIISGTAGTAQAKKEALEACGVRVGTNPTEVARLVAELVGVTAA